jgi:hypothetical protein
VDDRVDIRQSRPHGVVVPDVAVYELDVVGEVRRPCRVRMHLEVEAVEGADPVTLGEQTIGEMGADEAGAAGDQDVHAAGG